MIIELDLEAGMHSEERSAWPTDPKVYERIEMPASLRTFDPLRHRDYAHAAIRRRFSGLRPAVIECECVTQTAWIRPNANQPPEPKYYPRWYALLEMDEYRKQPDPVETRWQKFVRWARRQPLPVAEEPPRQRVFFSLSKMQMHMLREFLQGDSL